MMNETNTLETSARVPSDHLRSWAIACHLSPLIGFVGVPLGHLVGPLVFWLLKKHESDFLDRQGREALNFHLSMTVYCVGLLLLGIFPAAVLLSLDSSLSLIAIPWILLMGLAILLLIATDFILILVAALRTSNGDDFRYPLTLRFF